ITFVSTAFMQLFPCEAGCVERDGVLLHPRNDLFHVTNSLLRISDFRWYYQRPRHGNLDFSVLGEIAYGCGNEYTVVINSSYRGFHLGASNSEYSIEPFHISTPCVSKFADFIIFPDR